MLVVTESMVPVFRGKVLVTDTMGESDIATFELQVMNQDIIASESGDLTAGYAAVYSITYSSTGLDVTFADGASGDSIELPGCVGTYTVASSIVVSPSTTLTNSHLYSCIVFSYIAKLSPHPHDALAFGFIIFRYDPPSSCTKSTVHPITNISAILSKTNMLSMSVPSFVLSVYFQSY